MVFTGIGHQDTFFKQATIRRDFMVYTLFGSFTWIMNNLVFNAGLMYRPYKLFTVFLPVSYVCGTLYNQCMEYNRYIEKNQLLDRYERANARKKILEAGLEALQQKEQRLGPFHEIDPIFSNI